MTSTEPNYVMASAQQARIWDARMTSALGRYRSRRAIRAMYKSAERELSSYVTPSDISDLDSMLERSESDIVFTQLIERIRLRAVSTQAAKAA